MIRRVFARLLVRRSTIVAGLVVFMMPIVGTASPDLRINEAGYFAIPGLNVTVFSDIYPEGHQTGVTVIQHGRRVAANGDVRLGTSPGQWSPVPASGEQNVGRDEQRISQSMSYPDPTKDRKGFNPIVYPDLELSYTVHVQAMEDARFRVSVDLDEPLPADWVGKVGFNFELFPGHLFGKAFLMDGESGLFPTQPNGPIVSHHGEHLTAPLAQGKKLVIAPGEPLQRLAIESRSGELSLWDGRANHNNGWFIVRGLIPAGATDNAVEWVIEPNVEKSWRYRPALQVSQLGYAPEQPKTLVIEQDSRDRKRSKVSVYRLTEEGEKKVMSARPDAWGEFLRYHYLTFDFSAIREPGMYIVEYRGQRSHPVKIGTDVFARHAWQPTLEYYLPVQMCHMRVNEKYRVWHDRCHEDDALMSPVDHNHFDGYVSGPSTLTEFEPMEPVPGLNAGGWHDAGDYDLRVESQIGTTWLLSTMVENFDLDYDATLIDQKKQLVEIHHPDGKNDALQQIEHGLLTVLGGYRSLGRLYRGIIVPTQRQYVLLGDAGSQTDGLVYDANLAEEETKNGRSGRPDDRWVFTEENPDRELYVAGGLAAASRVMKTYDPALANEALTAAQAIFDAAFDKSDSTQNRVFALAELILATGDDALLEKLVSLQEEIINDIGRAGWSIGRVMPQVEDEQFVNAISEAVGTYQKQLRRESLETPYGVPYKPNIWGAGWTIQDFGVKQYFFHKGWPQHADTAFFVNALNFVLGVHPGENTESFASGVGSDSALVAYGVNRADWSYIPGGVISGTALIRPDLPELKEWPFFWQQTEYVMGGGGTNYMFLVLAADELYQ